jgi:hypothetical protein
VLKTRDWYRTVINAPVDKDRSDTTTCLTVRSVANKGREPDGQVALRQDRETPVRHAAKLELIRGRVGET